MSTIKLKRSAVAGKIPTIASLDLGEVALNTYDGRLYIKKSVNSVESIVMFAAGAPVAETSITVDTFIGDSSTVNYTLSRVPSSDQNVFVFLNGVLQHISEYSYSDNTLTFTTAPDLGDDVEIRIVDQMTTHVSLRDYKSYVYTFATPTSVFTGADDNGNLLTYDPTKVEVYANGVRLVDGDDYTATDSATVTLLSTISSGHVEIVSLAKAFFADHDALKPVNTPLTTTGVDQVVDTFQASLFRTAKYLVQMTSGTDFHATEVLIIHDGTTVYMTEAATIFSNVSLGTIDGDVSGGNVRLLVSPTNTNTIVKAQRLTVAV